MTPTIAIIGRPNVGKSTLFNYLTQSRDALVADAPGITRDRIYGEGEYHDKTFIVIDTGGIENAMSPDQLKQHLPAASREALENQCDLQALMTVQTETAIAEADAILLVVDARSGVVASDYFIAQQLRQQQKQVYIVVNKSDGMEAAIAAADFYALGFANVYPISAAQGQGISDLLGTVLAQFPQPTAELSEQQPVGIHVAIIGRPNAGKSTLINRMVGAERMVVSDVPGTTRDSVFIPLQRRNKNYVLIDTAGVRRRRSINDAIEKFSVVKTLQAITAANVVVFVVDARAGIAEQDLHLLGFVIDAGKSLVLAVNKWDGMSIEERESVKSELQRRLRFIDYARIHFISAMHGTGVGDIFTSIDEAYKAAMRKISTPKLTDILQAAVTAHQPPLVKGRRVKLRYAHLGGNNPVLIVIHGNQTEALPDSYVRFLAGYFRKALSLMGTPIQIQLKTGENPYENKKNVLTERQVKRRRRMVQFNKKK